MALAETNQQSKVNECTSQDNDLESEFQRLTIGNKVEDDLIGKQRIKAELDNGRETHHNDDGTFDTDSDGARTTDDSGDRESSNGGLQPNIPIITQTSESDKDPGTTTDLEEAIQRLFGKNQVQGQGNEPYIDIVKRSTLENIVCALFSQKIPPFDKMIDEDMALECAEFLYMNRNFNGSKFQLANNNELTAAANVLQCTFTRWRAEKRKSKAADGFCDFLRKCKNKVSGQETENGSEMNTEGLQQEKKPTYGFICVMQDEPDGLFKVGFSKNPELWLKQLQTGNVDLTLHHKHDEKYLSSEASAREKVIYAALEEYRVHRNEVNTTGWFAGCTSDKIKDVIQQHQLNARNVEKGKGFIYVMEDTPTGGKGRFKIGYAEDPELRLNQLQAGNVDLRLSYTHDKAYVLSELKDLEKTIHHALETYRIQRDNVRSTEWFENCTLGEIKNIIAQYA